FFFQAEDGIRDRNVTGVQTCALPILTIDMEYQKRLDKIVQKHLKNAIQQHPYQNRFLEDALAIAMNPKTGEILAMSGQHYNRKKIGRASCRERVLKWVLTE